MKDLEEYNKRYDNLLKNEQDTLNYVNECVRKADEFYKANVNPQNYELPVERSQEAQRLMENIKEAVKRFENAIDERLEFLKRGC